MQIRQMQDERYLFHASSVYFQESSSLDCWSRVTWTLGTRLPPSWDTEMCVRILFCLHLHSTCERRLHLLLHLRLRFMCQPALMHHYPELCSTWKARPVKYSKSLDLHVSQAASLCKHLTDLPADFFELICSISRLEFQKFVMTDY